MGAFVDITGSVFNKLTVIKRTGTNKQGEALWLCKCECGGSIITRGSSLRNGTTQSCGCLQFTQRQAMGRANANRLHDLTGKQFGKWLVVERVKSKPRTVLYKCKCECGTIKNVRATSLTTGASTSCGCYKAEKAAIQAKTHGLSRHPLYHVISDAIDRCHNPKAQEYHRYGARGITVCEEWRENRERFIEWAVSNGYAKGLTIDRIDNNRGYAPDNCRFVTQQENTNNRRNTVLVEIDGKKIPCTEAARIYGISAGKIRKRYRAGLRGKALLDKGDVINNGNS